MIPDSLIETTNHSITYWIVNLNPSRLKVSLFPLLTTKVHDQKNKQQTFFPTTVSSLATPKLASTSNITSFFSKNTRFSEGPSSSNTNSGPDIQSWRSWTRNSEKWDSLARNFSGIKTLLSWRNGKLNFRPTSTRSHAPRNPSFTDLSSR